LAITLGRPQLADIGFLSAVVIGDVRLALVLNNEDPSVLQHRHKIRVEAIS